MALAFKIVTSTKMIQLHTLHRILLLSAKMYFVFISDFCISPHTGFRRNRNLGHSLDPTTFWPNFAFACRQLSTSMDSFERRTFSAGTCLLQIRSPSLTTSSLFLNELSLAKKKAKKCQLFFHYSTHMLLHISPFCKGFPLTFISIPVSVYNRMVGLLISTLENWTWTKIWLE